MAGENEGALVGFLTSELVNPVSKQFYDFALSDLIHTRQNLLAALVAAVEGDRLTPKKPKSLKTFSELLFSDDLEFETTFRISRKTVRGLLCELRGCGYISEVEKEALLMLYCLGQSGPSQPDWLEISQVFDLAPGDSCRTFVKTCRFVAEKLKEKLVVWPSDQRAKHEVQLGLHRRYRFPRLLGVLGSVLLQGNTVGLELVIDHNHRFRWVSALGGVTEPTELLEKSGLGSRVLGESEDGLLLCGQLYPQQGSLLTPYVSPVNTEEKKFNYMHAKAASLLSESVQILTSRFPVLSCLQFDDLSHSEAVIEAACILHNLCINTHDMAPVTSFGPN